jgi:hypothetical protein
MTNNFTSVKKDSIKISDFISHLLGWNSKNDETRAICAADIRDMVL